MYRGIEGILQQQVEVYSSKATLRSRYLTAAPEPENLSFEDEILRELERSSNTGLTDQYRSTYQVPPTSNIVKRLFSITGIIIGPKVIGAAHNVARQ